MENKNNINVPGQLLSDKTYNILKWIVLIVLPATTTLVGAVGTSVGIENIQTILTIMVAVNTFLGSIIGVSTVQYNNNK